MKRGRPKSSTLLFVEDCFYVEVRELSASDVAEAVDGRKLCLMATWPTGEDMGVTLRFAITRPNYGGRRVWFRCRCGRRAARLYTPQPAIPLACRACHRLRYRSQYWTRPEFVLIRRWVLHPPVMTASARRQRDRRDQRKLEALSSPQFLASIG